MPRRTRLLLPADDLIALEALLIVHGDEPSTPRALILIGLRSDELSQTQRSYLLEISDHAHPVPFTVFPVQVNQPFAWIGITIAAIVDFTFGESESLLAFMPEQSTVFIGGPASLAVSYSFSKGNFVQKGEITAAHRAVHSTRRN